MLSNKLQNYLLIGGSIILLVLIVVYFKVLSMKEIPPVIPTSLPTIGPIKINLAPTPEVTLLPTGVPLGGNSLPSTISFGDLGIQGGTSGNSLNAKVI